MQLKLVIDSRERHPTFLDRFPDIERKNLDIGDFVIYSDNNPIYVFERKTISDLRSSICDGRYIEQKTRAISNFPNRFGYIIEIGNITSFWDLNTLENKSVQTAVVNTLIRDNIPIVFTQDSTDTCDFLVKQLERFGDPRYFEHTPNANAYSAALNIACKKSNNKTDPRSIAERQLAQFPGISLANAKSLLDLFQASTFTDFVVALKQDPNPAKRLQEVPGIGKKKITILLEYLNFV
jgi:ERCC4-type nuclease